MQQITLELFAPEAPTFENFIVGHNAEAVAALRALAQRTPAPDARLAAQVIVLWGAPGVGKSHLLEALATAARAAGRHALAATPHELCADPFVETDLLILDEVDRYDREGQAAAFTAFNHVQARGGAIAAACTEAPLTSPLRPDLRSRLGSGLVFEIRALPQDALPSLLRAYSAQCGFTIGDEVLAYVLTRYARDVRSLREALRAIDRLSLATHRPVTIPLARAALAALERQRRGHPC
ncbi:MAG: DnaA/Hda family protein [Casimicrobiaceae bacterium]|nr:DnaA/Hda family protein [Casimicrobiaceae bacterium]MCX8099518.1 DnaA/Hda family protein [Casimicrobiaceae bacterium]MDW8312244.1 DnaA/Hda family protein [Burkholderiales bacterium]